MKTNNLIDDISILVAEDELELREYLSEYLQIFFKHVYVAECGEDAYTQYLQKHPDIILTDINMPNLDGISLISRIRKEDITTKIIIMSAHSEQEKLLRAIELNLVTYLIKPIKTDILKSLLFEIVNELRASTKRLYLSKDIYWDKTSLTLWQKEREIVLKEKESLLLQLLCSNPNHAFTSKDIFDYIYKENNQKEFSEYAVTSFIKRVRIKLPTDIIYNEYGSGYKIITNHIIESE